MDDITRKSISTPDAGTGPTPRVIQRGRRNSCYVERPGDHGTRLSGPATIKLASLPLPAA